VHLAGVREQQIRQAADLDVAHAALNDIMGLPLDTPHDLTTPLSASPAPAGLLANLRKERRRRPARSSPGEILHQPC
jgi:outer membrane protein TolC